MVCPSKLTSTDEVVLLSHDAFPNKEMVFLVLVLMLTFGFFVRLFLARMTGS